MDPNTIIATAQSANAAAIGLAAATTTFSKAYSGMRKCSAYIPPAEYAFMEARCSVPILNAPDHLAAGSHPAASQCREWANDDVHNTFFAYDNVSDSWQLRKDMHNHRICMVGATDRELIRYAKIKNVSFMIANWEARDRGRLKDTLARGAGVGGDDKDKIFAGAGSLGIASKRIYYQRIPDEGDHFHYLIGYDCAYNITPAQWALWLYNTKAIGVYLTMLFPPELCFPDMPSNSFYKLYKVDNPRLMRTPSPDGARGFNTSLSTYRCTRDVLNSWVSHLGLEVRMIKYTGAMPPIASLNYQQYHHVLFCTAQQKVVGGPGSNVDYATLCALTNRSESDYRRSLEQLDRLVADLCALYNTLKAPTLTDIVSGKFRDIQNTLYSYINELFGVDAMALYEDIKLVWGCSTGAFDHAYVHNRATWTAYGAPGWVVPPISSCDGPLTPTMQIVVEHRQKYWLSHVVFLHNTWRAGSLYSVFTLPEADKYVVILDLFASTAFWRKGHRQLSFKSVSASLVLPLLGYCESLTEEQLTNDAILPQLVQWLRRQLATKGLVTGAPLRSAALDATEYAPIVLAVLFYVREQRSDMSVISGIFSPEGRYGARFVAWFARLFDGTILERLVDWFKNPSWRGKFIMPGTSEIQYTAYFDDAIEEPTCAPVDLVPYAPPITVTKQTVVVPDVDAAVASALDAMVDVDNCAHDPCCPVCVARLCSPTPAPFARVEHRPTRHTWRVPAQTIRDWIAEHKDNENDPAGLQALKETAAEMLKQYAVVDVEVAAAIYLIVGPPGTGKSVIARDIIANYLRDGPALVVSPFRKLIADYDGAKDSRNSVKFSVIKDSNKGGNIYFKTIHHAIIMPAVPVSCIVIDECGAIDYRLLTLLVQKFAAPIFLVGDPNQTRLRSDEGQELFDGLAQVGVTLDKLNTHSLVKNFRNPEGIIPTLNQFTADKMVAASGRIRGVQVVHVAKTPDWRAALPPRGEDFPGQYVDVVYSRNTGKLVFADDPPVKMPTVRSMQGMTLDNVALHVSAYDTQLLGEPSLNLVALSRHRANLVIVVWGNPDAQMYWFNKIGVHNVHYSELNETRLPVMPFVTTTDRRVLENEPPKPKYVTPANAVDVDQQINDAELGIENTDDIAKAAMRDKPLTGKYRNVEVGIDFDQHVTDAGNPRGEWGDTRLRLNATATAVPQLGQQRETARALLERQAEMLPKKALTDALRVRFRAVIDQAVALFCRPLPEDALEQCVVDLVRWVKDAGTRNYLGRIEGQASDPADQWSEIFDGALRGSMKNQVKVANSEKAGDAMSLWAKVGQALTAASVEATYRDAILVRFLSSVIAKSFKDTGVHRIVMNYAMTDAEFEERLNDAATSALGGVAPAVLYSDVTKADSGQTEGDAELVSYFIGKVLHHTRVCESPIEGSDVADRFMRMFRAVVGKKVIGPEIKFTVDFTVPSGIVWTFIRTTICVLMHNLFRVMEPGVSLPPCVIAPTGDDNVFLSGTPPDQALVARNVTYCDSFSNLKLYLMQHVGETAVEFCGRLVYVRADGVRVVPYLHRKYLRTRTLEKIANKDAVAKLAEYQIALRDWLARVEEVGAELVVVASAEKIYDELRKNAHGKPLPNYSVAVQQAWDEYDYLVSYSRYKPKDLIGKMHGVCDTRSANIF